MSEDGWLERFLGVSRVLDVDRETAARDADVRAARRARGKPIPANAAWSAALALQHRLPVVSRDTHFDEVRGVRRIGW